MTSTQAPELRIARRIMHLAFMVGVGLLIGGFILAGPSGYGAPMLELAMLECGIASFSIGLFLLSRLQAEDPPPRKLRLVPGETTLPAAVSDRHAA